MKPVEEAEKKWKLEHLPKGTSNAFTNQLVPLAKSLAGSLSPWEGLSKEQVQKLVDKIYGSAQYTVQDAPMDPWGPLVSDMFFNYLDQANMTSKHTD